MKFLFTPIVLFVLNLAGGTAKAANVCSSCQPYNIGDLVHRGSSWDSVFVGHAGFKGGNVSHVMPSDLPGKALQSTSLEAFINGHEYYGAKRLHSAPQHATHSAEAWIDWVDRVFDKLEFLACTGVDYDTRHTNQKGGRNDAGRFVFDCVGFAEHMWEYFGHNPTPDEFESGTGWPLTVYEQRDSPNVSDATWEPL